MSPRELRGIAAAEGVASGQAWLYRARGAISGPAPAVGSAQEERDRFVAARDVVARQLSQLTDEFGSEQQEVGAIFDAHALMLRDPSLTQCTLDLIDEGSGAEEAVRRCGERFASKLQRMPNETLRDRAADCREVTDRLLSALLHETTVRARHDLAGRVVVARHLPPGEAVRMLRAGAVALVLEHGGTTSHTAIVARALGVPAVVGVPEPLAVIEAGTRVKVDGDRGVVLVGPGVSETVAESRQARRTGFAVGPCRTADGERVALAANIELPEELRLVAESGAEGIGLYRSEFLLMETDPDLPDEELQIERYGQLLRSAAPHEAVVRTYDLGGRKLAREVLATQEAHPSLGLRGIRILNLRRHLFHTQVRALLRASAEVGVEDGGGLKILLPMVSTVDEVVGFRNFLQEVGRELGIRNLPEVGAMIETPASALICRPLGEVADFLSVGTNDLVQYTVAAERDNEHVADLYQPYHPGVLRLLRCAVEGAEAAGVPLSVCGEIAADASGQVMLTALGVRRLSLHPARIPDARGLLPVLDCRKLQTLAKQCMACATAAQVEALLAAETERALS